MTPEQKAKAYDEAIERASKLRVQNPFDTVSQMMEHVFPELCESEDDKIKQKIIKLIKMSNEVGGFALHKWEADEMLAWLEKQGEQKLQIENLSSEMKTIGESLGFTTQKECDEYNKLVSELIMSDGNKGELKKIEDEEYNGEDYGIDSLYHAQRILEKTLGSVDGYQTDDGILDHRAAITAVKKLYEQKPAEWKQENAEELSDFENAMMHIGRSFFGKNAGLDPNDTNAIKEQAKLLLELTNTHKWSEEDERLLSKLQTYVDMECFDRECNGQDLIDWLKSLRPQNCWKPSDEQMEAIRIAAEVGTANDSWAMGVLRNMYNDLKKEYGNESSNNRQYE